nr:hypothetical protein [Tanacetum cinerariifolium]
MKSMMTEMYHAFKGQPPSAPSSSQTITLALTDIPTNVEGENIETATEEPTTKVPVIKEPVVNQPIPKEGPSHTEGETANIIFKELDELREIIPKRKNNVVSLMMNSFGKRYEKVKKLPEELGMQLALPPPKEAEKIGLNPKKVITQKSRQVFKKAQADELKDLNLQRNEKLALPPPVTKTSKAKCLGRKRKQIELEPETKVPALECDRHLRKGVKFVNNMVIEKHEYGMFFTNALGEQAFQRWSDIRNAAIEAIVSYLVMAAIILHWLWDTVWIKYFVFLWYVFCNR